MVFLDSRRVSIVHKCPFNLCGVPSARYGGCKRETASAVATMCSWAESLWLRTDIALKGSLLTLAELVAGCGTTVAQRVRAGTFRCFPLMGKVGQSVVNVISS